MTIPWRVVILVEGLLRCDLFSRFLCKEREVGLVLDFEK